MMTIEARSVFLTFVIIHRFEKLCESFREILNFCIFFSKCFIVRSFVIKSDLR